MGHQFDCTKVKLITRLAHEPKRGPWGFIGGDSARPERSAASGVHDSWGGLSQIALQAALVHIGSGQRGRADRDDVGARHRWVACSMWCMGQVFERTCPVNVQTSGTPGLKNMVAVNVMIRAPETTCRVTIPWSPLRTLVLLPPARPKEGLPLVLSADPDADCVLLL
jgi:hypothetical protein